MATGPGPVPESAASIRWRGIQAWTIAEMAKPSTSAHQTWYAIKAASFKPLRKVSMGGREYIP